MTWLEIAGSIALWILGTWVLCIASAFIGSLFGNGKGMGGLVYVIYPPIVILIISAISGLILLGRISL